MRRFFRWLWRFLIRKRAPARPARVPPPRRLGLEGLEDRRLFSVAGAALLRLDGPARIADVRARLNPQDPRTVQLGDRAGTAWQDVALPAGPAGVPAGGVVLTGPAGAAPRRLLVVISDLNDDGLADLAIHSGAAVQVRLGRADGSFAPQSRAAEHVPFDTSVFEAGDFNGDGQLDLLAVGRPAAGRHDVASLLLGGADGTFQAARASLADPGVVWSTVGGASRDGKPSASPGSHNREQAAFPGGPRADATAAPASPASTDGSDGSPGNQAAPGDGPAGDPGSGPGPADDQPGGAGGNSGQTTGGAAPAGSPAGPGVWAEPHGDGAAPESGGPLSPPQADGGRPETLPAETPTPAGAVVLPGPGRDSEGSEPSRTISGGATISNAARPGTGDQAAVPALGPGERSAGLPAHATGVGPADRGPAGDLLGNVLAGQELSPPAAARGRAALALPAGRPAGAAAGEAQHWSVADLGRILAQAFYLGNLKQAGANPDPQAAAALLQAPGDTRLLVADLIQRSTEAFTRLVQAFYVHFLGRAAAGGEEAGWVGMLLSGQTEEQVLSAFLSTAEFYTRAGGLVPAGTADERFVRALYDLLLQRPATDGEVGGWLGALPALGRGGVASALLASAEYRSRRVEGYYRDLLGRPAGAAEVASWADSPFDLLTIRLFFESHADLLANP